MAWTGGCGAPDRLDADSGSRNGRRQPVQRIAGGRYDVCANREPCRVRDCGPEGERATRSRSSASRPARPCSSTGEFLVAMRLPRPAAAHRRRVSAIDSAHRDGHRRCRRRRQHHARRAADVCTAARVAIGAVAPTRAAACPKRQPRWSVRRLDDDALARAAAAASVAAQADRRQARNGCLPTIGCRRADQARRGDCRRRGQRVTDVRSCISRRRSTESRPNSCAIRTKRCSSALRNSARPDRHERRLLDRRLRRVLGAARRPAGAVVPGARARSAGPNRDDDRRHGARGSSASVAAEVSRTRGAAMRHLHAWLHRRGQRRCSTRIRTRPRREVRYWLAGQSVPLYRLRQDHQSGDGRGRGDCKRRRYERHDVVQVHRHAADSSRRRGQGDRSRQLRRRFHAAGDAPRRGVAQPARPRPHRID